MTTEWGQNCDKSEIDEIEPETASGSWKWGKSWYVVWNLRGVSLVRYVGGETSIELCALLVDWLIHARRLFVRVLKGVGRSDLELCERCDRQTERKKKMG